MFNISKNIASRFLIILALSFVFGSSLLLVLVPVMIYGLIRFFIDVFKFFKDRSSWKKVILVNSINSFVLVLSIFFLSKFHIDYARNNFKRDVALIQDFQKKQSKFPASLDMAKVDANPYMTVLGPRYDYQLINETPLFCLIEVYPFGRKCFNFEMNKETSID